MSSPTATALSQVFAGSYDKGSADGFPQIKLKFKPSGDLWERNFPAMAVQPSCNVGLFTPFCGLVIADHIFAGQFVSFIDDDTVKVDITDFGEPRLIPCTGAGATEIFTATAHGLVNGQAVAFTGTGLAGSLVEGTTYYVRDKSANTFKVSATLGGAVFALSSDSTSMAVTRAIAGWFNAGRVNIITGDVVSVVAISESGFVYGGRYIELTLDRPFRTDPVATNVMAFVRACDGKWSTCQTLGGNFRGFPHIPPASPTNSNIRKNNSPAGKK